MERIGEQGVDITVEMGREGRTQDTKALHPMVFSSSLYY